MDDNGVIAVDEASIEQSLDRTFKQNVIEQEKARLEATRHQLALARPKSLLYRQLETQIADIEARIAAHAQDNVETERDHLIRTGKITPFAQGPLNNPSTESHALPDLIVDHSPDDGNLLFYHERLQRWAERLGSSDAQECMFRPSPNDFSIQSLIIPANIYGRLFEYQKTCVRWLWELHQQETGGIIADEMVTLEKDSSK
jgi:SNF2 family DNA or RNA helicase